MSPHCHLMEEKRMTLSQPRTEAIALTQGPKHHFFGYYDIPTWDITGKYVLALESEPVDPRL